MWSRRARNVFVAMFAACTSSAPERLSNPAARPQPPPQAYAMSATATRPAIDLASYLPDFHDELRWPFSVAIHPALEPRFPIAREIAEPGVRWAQLCTPTVLDRHVIGASANELLEYLRGWCAAESGDADTALEHLAHVRGSMVTNLAAALTLDVPFILVTRDAAEAEALLQKHRLNDVRILDNLAAAYVEIGRDNDATIINRRAIEFSGRGNPDYCHRAARDVLLGGGDLESFAESQAASSNPTCISLVHALRCSLARQCEDYERDRSGNLLAALVVSVYDAWPDGVADYQRWQQLAYEADLALPLDDALQLGRAALPAMVRASTCTAAQVDQIRARAIHFEVAELTELTIELCTRIALLSPAETLERLRLGGPIVLSADSAEPCGRKHVPPEKKMAAPPWRSVPPRALPRISCPGQDRSVKPDVATERKLINGNVRRVMATFQFCVDEHGSVVFVSPLKSSGYAEYDVELANDIWDRRYLPYKLNHRSVPVCSATTEMYSR